MSADERVGSESRASLAGDLALLGGRLALERFHRAQASMRRDGIRVPDADVAIQDALGSEIARCFPTDGLAGEEALLNGARTQPRYEWILGPIDAPADFARGLPGFVISVGVLRDGAVFAGAVYDPIARWLFTGCAGRGAWLNERPLHVGGAVRPEGTLFSARTPFTAGMPEFVDEWMRRYQVRRFGSTALHLCYVALGGLDFVYDDRATVWDIAGAAAVIFEAGGMLTVDDGAPLFPMSAAQTAGAPIALLAGHPLAHAAALCRIQAARAVAAAR